MVDIMLHVGVVLFEPFELSTDGALYVVVIVVRVPNEIPLVGYPEYRVAFGTAYFTEVIF